MRRWWFWLLLSVAGCPAYVPPEERVENGWDLARAALTNGESCFAGRPEYCISEPAFVDSFIQKRLDALYGGKMPIRRTHVEATTRNAAIEYKRALLAPERVAAVEELVREHYHNPQAISGETGVSIDLGVVPGKLEARPTTASLAMVSSELVAGGEWLPSERARVLSEYVAKYPDKAEVRVAVTIPVADGLAVYSYRYLRPDDRVVVVGPSGEMRTTKRGVGVDDLKSARVALDFPSLTSCRASRSPGPKDRDPPTTCPPDPLHPSQR